MLTKYINGLIIKLGFYFIGFHLLILYNIKI